MDLPRHRRGGKPRDSLPCPRCLRAGEGGVSAGTSSANLMRLRVPNTLRRDPLRGSRLTRWELRTTVRPSRLPDPRRRLLDSEGVHRTPRSARIFLYNRRVRASSPRRGGFR